MTYTEPFITATARAGIYFTRGQLESYALPSMMPAGLMVPAEPEPKPADAYAWAAIVQLTLDRVQQGSPSTLVTSAGRMFLALGEAGLLDTDPVPIWANVPDGRACGHAGTDLDCDCDTIAAEIAGND